MATVGIRREDKHQWEARVPLTPEAVRELCNQGIQVLVQPSTIRAFDDDSYRQAGALIQEDIGQADVVLAVKEIPRKLLRKNGAYVFFSHTIKGQKQNMPLLQRLMDLECTLFDYERIVNEEGKRLVFFGRHAGLAGMLDTLAVLGRRLESLGHDNSFSQLKLAFEYQDLAAAKQALRDLGANLVVPKAIAPLVVGFAGYGNVSQGAQAMLDCLPVEEVAPDDVAAVVEAHRETTDRAFKVVYKESDLVQPRNHAQPFVLEEYFTEPEKYESVFASKVTQLSVLVNAIYWTKRYPRLVQSDGLKKNGLGRLLIVGDISCDIHGSVECTVKATTPGMPCYVYEPQTGSVRDGWEGPGLAMMTTDCLPCELPRESSASFTEALAPFVPPLAKLDHSKSFDEVNLPFPIKQAAILWRGKLTPDYQYLKPHLEKAAAG